MHDDTGCISGGCPTTYLILSGEPRDKGGWKWQAADFYDAPACGYWLGAPVKELWDEDIARLRKVGYLQRSHLKVGVWLRFLWWVREHILGIE
jgi:hypothetical protein